MKKYTAHILCWLLLLGAYSSHGQNLIYNSSFELGMCEPDYTNLGNNGLTYESGWLNPFNTKNLCGINSCTPYVNSNVNAFSHHAPKSRNLCCGRGCETSVSGYQLNDSHGILGTFYFDSLGFTHNSPYTSQSLMESLEKGHRYYFYTFYSNQWLIGRLKSDGTIFYISPYEAGLSPRPNTKHNGFGLVCSTNPIVFAKPPQNDGQQHIPSHELNQRKLRFITEYQPYWQRWEGSFVADSNYSYITLGNFWKTEECTFTPPLSGSTIGPYTLSIDSVNMWDVTHRIVADTAYCTQYTAQLTTQNYSRGVTTWYNGAGDLLHTGDTFSVLLS